MADESDEGPGNRAEHGSHEAEHAVLNGNAGVGHRTGDRDEASADKEECSTDADGNDRLDRKLIVHNESSSFLKS